MGILYDYLIIVMYILSVLSDLVDMLLFCCKPLMLAVTILIILLI